MKNAKKLMKQTLAGIAISAFSLMFIVFADFDGNIIQRVIAYSVGICFWGFLVYSYICFFRISKIRKEDKKTNTDKIIKSNLPGIICFFSNDLAIKADIIMIVFFICSVVFSIIDINKNISIIFVSFFVCFVQYHSILNGINYKFIYKINEEKSK